MVRITTEDQALQNINISEIATYLTRIDSRWRSVPCKNDRLRAFEGPRDDNGKKVVIFLPAKNGFFDEKERVADAINVLAVIEHVSPHEVIQQIRTFNRDVVQLRLLTPAGITPPLEQALQILNGLRDLIFFAACMEENPRAYIPGRRQRVGYQQLQNCSLGHTFSGSFGFTIEVPLSDQALPGISDYIPFSRRVVERIIRGLAFASEAERRQSSDIISKSFMNGLNSNMCTAVLETFGQDQDMKMEYGVSWSSLLQPRAQLRKIEPVTVSKNTYKYLEEAASSLRQMRPDGFLEGAVHVAPLLQVASESQTIYGKVKNLNAESKNRRIATIIDNKGRIIEVPLEEDFYEIAFKAHIDYLNVGVTGNVVQEHNKIRMNNVTKFQILE